MKRILLPILIFSFLLIFVSSGLAQKATRIRFSRGAKSQIVTGRLVDQKHQKVFALRVRAGQTLKTESIGSRNLITIMIEQPDGTPYEGDMDLSCHSRHEVSPTLAGDYKLVVTECLKADAWTGKFKFRVTVR